MEYCYHIWAGASQHTLSSLDSIQKRIRPLVGRHLYFTLQLLAHCQNVASLSLFYRYFHVNALMSFTHWFLLFVFLIVILIFQCLADNTQIVSKYPSHNVIFMNLISFLPLRNYETLFLMFFHLFIIYLLSSLMLIDILSHCDLLLVLVFTLSFLFLLVTHCISLALVALLWMNFNK